MVCVTYYAAAPVPVPITTPAPVIASSITVTKIGESVTHDSVSISAMFGDGVSSPSATVRLDGILIGYMNRVPNGTGIWAPVDIPRDGAAHSICVE